MDVDGDAGYAIEHVRRALAQDERIGQLDVSVIPSGKVLRLTGVVGTEERRAAISEVAGAAAPDWEIDNQTVVEELQPPRAAEDLP